MIGYDFFLDEALLWRDNQGGLLPLSPPQKFLSFGGFHAAQLLRIKRKHFIRWESDFDCAVEFPWWHVIKDVPESLDVLPKKTRYMIRKAEAAYEAIPVEVDVILEHGYQVYVDAYKRYETYEPMYSEEEFTRAVSQLPDGTEWWAVFDRQSGRIVAFSENYVEGETCFYVSMWFDPDAMSKFVGYLLFHKMEIYYLYERRFRYVSDGARSLSHDTNIHDFLISKFNFRRAYAKLNVVYSPWLGVLVAAAYPFRRVLDKSSLAVARKASILLKQESIRRECSALASQ